MFRRPAISYCKKVHFVYLVQLKSNFYSGKCENETKTFFPNLLFIGMQACSYKKNITNIFFLIQKQKNIKCDKTFRHSTQLNYVTVLDTAKVRI